MYITNKKQNNILEKFRIKAHLRRYLKDPIIIDESLLSKAVIELKKLPYIDKDPSESVAINLLLEAYRLGYYKHQDLTECGYEMVTHSKFRGHHQMTRRRSFCEQAMRSDNLLKA